MDGDGQLFSQLVQFLVELLRGDWLTAFFLDRFQFLLELGQLDIQFPYFLLQSRNIFHTSPHPFLATCVSSRSRTRYGAVL